MAGLAQQGVKSRRGGGQCAYRGDGRGLKGKPLRCGVGFCIPDRLYDPMFDRSASGYFASKDMNKSKAIAEYWGPEITPYFADALQRIHDVYEPDEWKNAGRVFAGLWNWSTEKFDKLQWAVKQCAPGGGHA